MKTKMQLIICLTAIIIGLLSFEATAQNVAPMRRQVTTKFVSSYSGALLYGESQDASDAAAEILEKHVLALGGLNAFTVLKSVDVQIERSVLGRTIKTRQIGDLTGNRSYQRQDNGNGIIETGYDGQKVWQKAPFFKGYLDDSNVQAKSLKRGGIRLPGTSLYNYKTSEGKFTRQPDESLDGKNYFVLSSEYKDELGKETKVKYYFDPTTYLLKKVVTGAAVTQTETFDDYRKVEGLTIAHASTITNPQFTITNKITGLKLNVPIDASIFEFKEAAANPTATVEKTSASLQTELPKQTGASNELSESLRLETFERVWKIVNDTFYDRTFNNVDWQAIHERYLPLAKQTTQSDGFHKLLNKMVQELRLSHFRVMQPENVLTLSSRPRDLNTGSIGLGFQWIDNQLLVSSVKKDSPAEAAGIRSGFILKRINGKTPEELYVEYQKNNPGFQLKEELARPRALGTELGGEPETKVNLELIGEGSDLLKLELLRKAQPGGRQLEFESKKLDGSIGYIKFNSFFGELLPKFQTALSQLHDTKALIIDLRGNGGGAGDLARSLAGLLNDMPGSLGNVKFRYETQQFSYEGSGEKAYKGKVLILTNEGTASSSEVFASGLQAKKRASVVGSVSAGAALPSLVELLPTGGALQYVVSNFETLDGKLLEGNGVKPDHVVRPSRQGLLAGRDEVLERAVSFINGKN